MSFNFNKPKVIQHTIFWIVYGTFWHFVWSPDWYNLSSIGVSLIFTLANIFAAYSVIYLLVPKLLNKRKILSFLFGLVAVLFVTAALHGLVLYGYLYFLNPSAVGAFFGSDMATPSLLGSNTSAMLLVLALQQYFSRKTEEDRRKEIEKQNLETELKYLKNQLKSTLSF